MDAVPEMPNGQDWSSTPAPPSWEAAIEERRSKQFMKLERKHGRPTGRRVKFAMFEPIDDIAAESPGLGFFFRFNALLRRFLAIMMLLCLYPLARNIATRNNMTSATSAPLSHTSIVPPSETYSLAVDTEPSGVAAADFWGRMKTESSWIKYANLPAAPSWAALDMAARNNTSLSRNCIKTKGKISNAIVDTTVGSICTDDTAGLACDNVCVTQPWCAFIRPLACNNDEAGGEVADATGYCPLGRGTPGGNIPGLRTKAKSGRINEFECTLSRKNVPDRLFADIENRRVQPSDVTAFYQALNRNQSGCWDLFLNSTCTCCTLKFVKDSANIWAANLTHPLRTSDLDFTQKVELPRGHVGIFFAVFLLYLAWLLYSQAIEHASFDRVNAKTITAADYSVWVTGLDRSRCDNDGLAQFARHYGEVVAAFHVPLLGPALSRCTKIEDANIMLAELEALKAKAPYRVAGRGGCLGFVDALGAWAVKQYLCWSTLALSPRAAVTAQEAKISKLREELSHAQEGPLVSSGIGIIIFNYERHAKNFLRQSRYNKPFLLTSCGTHISRETAVARPAPEPRTIFWENAHAAGATVVWWRLLSWGVFVAVLIASAVAQTQLFTYTQQELSNRLAQESAGSGSVFSKGTALVKSNIWAVVSALVVTIINILGYHLSNITTSWEKHILASHHIRSHTVKLTLFYLINSILLVLSRPVKDNRDLWYQVGGLANSLFFIQLLDAFLPVIFYLWEPLTMTYYFFMSRYAHSQVYLNWCLSPLEFDLPYRYASLVKTLGLAILYSPLLPLSPFIALAGVIAALFVDRYTALRVDAKPKDLDRDVRLSLSWILHLLAPMQIYLFAFVYFPDTVKQDHALQAGLVFLFVLWLVVLFGPHLWSLLRSALSKQEFGVADQGRICSFWATVGDASPALIYQTHRQGPSTARGFVLDEYSVGSINSQNKKIFHDIYSPFPLRTSHMLKPEWCNTVIEHLRPFPKPLEPNLKLHTGQLEELGGEACHNPGNTAVLWQPTPAFHGGPNSAVPARGRRQGASPAALAPAAAAQPPLRPAAFNGDARPLVGESVDVTVQATNRRGPRNG